ncbi:MAG: ABC transporter substrate-binding protein [Deltaproteobacteria bacterium]|jgi:iron complex transport system substrate-binding protein|nr:ABC transporter substrate-binding protein [Deltaproteobacteria bacterium]
MKALFAISAALACLLAAALSGGGPEPVRIVNWRYDLTENVEVFDRVPERVVSTNGSATELLLALGLEDRMVGTAYLDNPPLPEHLEAYNRIPVLSKRYPHKETVLFLEPDLLVGWHSAFAPQTLGDPSRWNELGVWTFILRDSAGLPRKLENIRDDIRDLGRIFRIEDRAEAILLDMRKRMAVMSEKAGGRDGKKLRVMILECMPGYRLRVWGDDSTPGQMLLAIGAENVFPKTGDQNRESIAAANPDAVIFIYMDSALEDTLKLARDFKTDRILKYVKASGDDRMGLVPLSETYCPEVRVVAGMERMSRILFPDEWDGGAPGPGETLPPTGSLGAAGGI